MDLQFSDFKIVPDISTIKRKDISDEIYFSKKYSRYISNSRLKNIDPTQGGSPMKYLENPHISTSSLKIGSAIHEILLQPDDFVLAPKMGKPTAKLGEVADYVYTHRKEGVSIEDTIREASKKIGYYVNQIESKIPGIIEKCTPYWEALDQPRWKKKKQEEIFLSDKDHDLVTSCLQSCYDNKQIMNKLHPTDMFDDPCPSFNEDAIFMDFLVTYEDSRCVRLPFKLKIDNWTINFDDKVVTLNDLKTTGHPVNWFMNQEYGSFFKYQYYRQMYIYSMILWHYCQQKYGVSKELGWTLDCNILAVQTLPDYSSKCINISKNHLKRGKEEFEELIKRVAACELFGYDQEFNFI